MDFAKQQPTIFLRQVEGGPAAMISRSGEDPEILRPRDDLFPYHGGFAWGYVGSGPSNLAVAILAECLENADDVLPNAETLVNNLIAHLNELCSYNLAGADILAALKIWPNKIKIASWEHRPGSEG